MLADLQEFDCPLCLSSQTRPFYRNDLRDFLRCGQCHLVFVPAAFFLSLQDERACYDHHQNCPHDLRYRKFLSRLAEPLIERLTPGARGMDFGSGPGPTLSLMMAEAGHPTQIFDPYYHCDQAVWQDQYDFVTASEVVEHLHAPRADLKRCWDVLRPGGILAVMTKRVIENTEFASWHYKNDPTHVVFFSDETFRWVAADWHAQCDIIGTDVVLITKQPAPDEPIRARG